jgi:hypothetical protein
MHIRIRPSAIMPALIISAVAAALVGLPLSGARAAEQVVTHVSGAPDAFEFAGKTADVLGSGHIVEFDAPKDWPLVFAREVSFYARRAGAGDIKMGNVVLWEDNPLKEDEKPEDHVPYRVLLQKNFNLADIPEAGGWTKVTLDPIALPRKFFVAVYTFSSEAAQVQLGLGPKARAKSHSGLFHPAQMGEGGKGMEKRRDGREWLLSITVADTVAATNTVRSEDLSGADFSSWDDGSAESFDTMQKCGAMVKFHTDSPRKIKKVWAYCKLQGEWFKTQRRAGCWVMNDRWGILNRQDLPYSQYTNEASWGGVDIPSIEVSGDFYILVEPVSRPKIEMLIGVDSSGENMGSLYGNAGSVQVWECAAPEEATNWMIRVEYE